MTFRSVTFFAALFLTACSESGQDPQQKGTKTVPPGPTPIEVELDRTPPRVVFKVNTHGGGDTKFKNVAPKLVAIQVESYFWAGELKKEHIEDLEAARPKSGGVNLEFQNADLHAALTKHVGKMAMVAVALVHTADDKPDQSSIEHRYDVKITQKTE